MDTPLLITVLFCFTCSLFFHVAGGVHDQMMQPHRCHDEERSALLEFKEDLVIDRSQDPANYHKTDSWKAGGDCCSGWDGVECDQLTGHVIGLDLSSTSASKTYINVYISGNSTLFQLFHLQKLNLSNNVLEGGQIPFSIFRLSNLSSLDLSSEYSGSVLYPRLRLDRPSLKDLVDNLTKLEHLHLDTVNLTGSILPDSFSKNSCLKSIRLSYCGLSGELPSDIFHLPKLRILDLSHNPSLSVHFSEFEGSSFLEELRIGFCNFSGGLTSLGRLVNLTYLDLSNSYFLGFKSSSFSWLSSLTKLTHLDLNGMKINGEIPSQIAHLTALNYLDLSYNDLRGQMTPAWLSNLTQLVTLDLSHNQLTGQIPSLTLSLNNDRLAGSVPPFLTNQSNLQHIDLSHNQLTGQIPYFLSTLTKLVTLSLNKNRLTGSIPPFLTNLSNLQRLDLSFNLLVGEIPNSFSHLSNLQSLDLYSNNLNGTVELDVFHKLRYLSTLKLSRNNLSLLVNEGSNSMAPDKYTFLELGSCNLSNFPQFLRNQSVLFWLDLSQNNIHGMVPIWLWNNSLSLDCLNISHNFLTTVEDQPILNSWSELRTLDISFNMLQGSLPVLSLSINFYLASNNRWSGYLSPHFCNLTHLSVLDASNNNISGTIPQCLGTFGTSLSILDLRNNKLHGTIPHSWNHGSHLKVIALSQNQLQGKVPRSLRNCKELEFMDLGNNQIVDTFPSWLGSLSKLKVLMLQSNRFHGEIQNLEGDSQFAQLRIIDLSFNGFSGMIPSMYFQSWKFMESFDEAMEYMEFKLVSNWYYVGPEIGYYKYSMKINSKGMERLYSKIPNILRAIDFSHNLFEGEIPSSIAKLKGLHLLNLGHNNFTGTIPSWLGDLHQLESLDLSHNKLSGKVPQEVTHRSSLSFFNVSYNNLSGIIPHGGHSDTFDNSSYIGNPRLLAYHPTQPPTLTPETGEEEEEDDEDEPVFDKIEWMVILMGCGSGLVVGVVLGNELVVRKSLWFVKFLGGWL